MQADILTLGSAAEKTSTMGGESDDRSAGEDIAGRLRGSCGDERQRLSRSRRRSVNW
jgi:hypothetical protein